MTRKTAFPIASSTRSLASRSEGGPELPAGTACALAEAACPWPYAPPRAELLVDDPARPSDPDAILAHLKLRRAVSLFMAGASIEIVTSVLGACLSSAANAAWETSFEAYSAWPRLLLVFMVLSTSAIGLSLASGSLYFARAVKGRRAAFGYLAAAVCAVAIAGVPICLLVSHPFLDLSLPIVPALRVLAWAAVLPSLQWSRRSVDLHRRTGLLLPWALLAVPALDKVLWALGAPRPFSTWAFGVVSAIAYLAFLVTVIVLSLSARRRL